jgi:hypothetical protein
VLEGKVIGQRMRRHRHQPTPLTVHVIVDNYAAHKHPKVLEWLARHPRLVLHFTPTSASSMLSKVCSRSSPSAASTAACFVRSRNSRTQSHSFIADTNANPKPFIWTKDPGKIIAAVKRGHQALDSIH